MKRYLLPFIVAEILILPGLPAFSMDVEAIAHNEGSISGRLTAGMEVDIQSAYESIEWGHRQVGFGDWSRIDWMGWIWSGYDSNWSYLLGYDWIYPITAFASPDDAFLYSNQDGWLYTHSDFFPFAYFYTNGAWLELPGMVQPRFQAPPEPNAEAILSIMQRVADWQLANPSSHPTDDWTHGAFYAGLVELARLAPDSGYWNALLGFGNANAWDLGDRTYHADDHAVGQMYAEAFREFGNATYIAKMEDQFRYILANQQTGPLDFGSRATRWGWCDALFMSPPVWTKLANILDDSTFLDFMNQEWWATTDYLYDETIHLYYRDDRYFNQLDPDGIKNFWSRGNGWVFAGLTRVLQELPQDYPDRARYETLFKEMAGKLLEIQGNDGLWRSSLLNPVRYHPPEASGSAFFCYGLAWGVNSGLLPPEQYEESIKKAWAGLQICVHPDGMLGYVQPIGGAPAQVEYNFTEVYGTGAFLLAGSEVLKLAGN